MGYQLVHHHCYFHVIDNYFSIKDLLESDITSETKIKRIVLEVLASATHHSQDTRFFSDWLRANFLTREDVDESVSIADKVCV